VDAPIEPTPVAPAPDRHPGASAADREALAAFLPVVARHADELAAALAEQLRPHAAPSRTWILSLCAGARGGPPASTGHEHPLARLPLRRALVALADLRARMSALAETSFASDPRRRAILAAVGRAIDGELVLAVEEHEEGEEDPARELAARSRQAERLAALGTMTAGLAHEIRNPLNAAHLQLSVGARRLAAHPPEVPGALQALAAAEAEMRRLACLLDEFLEFSRPSPVHLAADDLRACAEEVVRALAAEARGAEVTLTLAPGPAVPARMDRERMRQVLVNLGRNALEATGPGGHVELIVRAHPDLVSVAVSDDGPGLPTAASRIFEPFFTTKPTGTGLGLSIVHRIVSDHDGEITVRRQRGRTVFTVFLPR
jgi:signal transduction histidine kinase